MHNDMSDPRANLRFQVASTALRNPLPGLLAIESNIRSMRVLFHNRNNDFGFETGRFSSQSRHDQ